MANNSEEGELIPQQAATQPETDETQSIQSSTDEYINTNLEISAGHALENDQDEASASPSSPAFLTVSDEQQSSNNINKDEATPTNHPEAPSTASEPQSSSSAESIVSPSYPKESVNSSPNDSTSQENEEHVPASLQDPYKDEETSSNTIPDGTIEPTETVTSFDDSAFSQRDSLDNDDREDSGSLEDKEENCWASSTHETTENFDTSTSAANDADDFADWSTADNGDEWGNGDANDDDFADFGDFPSTENSNSSNVAPPSQSHTSSTSSSIAESSKTIASSHPSLLRGTKDEILDKIGSLLMPLNTAHLNFSSPSLQQIDSPPLESMASPTQNAVWQPKDSKRSPKPVFRGTFFETNFLAALGKQPLPTVDQGLASFIKKTPSSTLSRRRDSSPSNTVPFSLNPSHSLPLSPSTSFPSTSSLTPTPLEVKASPENSSVASLAPSASFDLSFFGPAPTPTQVATPPAIQDSSNWLSSLMSPSTPAPEASILPVQLPLQENTSKALQDDSYVPTTNIATTFEQEMPKEARSVHQSSEVPLEGVGGIIQKILKLMPDFAFMHDSTVSSSKRV